ncbi:hypothetical protein PG984_007803 [Apiospora sp. TS-2023a]
MAQSQPIPDDQVPIILCGKSLEVGEKVAPLIQPEMDVIHFINSYDDAKSDLGHLLAGHGPKSSTPNHIGSHDYSRPPRAVIFGRAFQADDVKEMHRLHCGSSAGPIAWIAGDPSIVPPPNPGPGYAEKGADNVKRAFLKWKEQGADSEEIIWY